METSKRVKQTYYLLILLQTLAASFIWGINTIFLLDAGLSNAQAFAANAFFTLGQVLFEVPTGIVADTKGRKLSYLLGVFTLLTTTLVYFWLWQIHGPFWGWAVVSALLGLGFTFFSGATEAWLVDALNYTGYQEKLDSVFAKAQTIGGIAMLAGSVTGGLIAQATNLGIPYIIRAILLGITFVASLLLMKDLGFIPKQGESVVKNIKSIISESVENGWKNKPVKWLMLSAPFTGIGIYVFYASQPYLLELAGKPNSYSIAGLTAAIVAGAQIAGGLSVNLVSKYFFTRTNILIGAGILGTFSLILLGLMPNFWAALGLLIIWGILSAVAGPVRQAYLNGLIASSNRATVLSFDSLMNNGGSAVTQPILGKSADLYGYGFSYILSGIIQAGSIPFLLLAKLKHSPADRIEK